MKIRILILALILRMASFPVFAGNDLEVKILGLSPVSGDLYIALYDNADAYMNPEQAARKLKVAVDADTVFVVFDDLPAGDYAISCYHDVNLNGIHDKHGNGMPKESFAFSNNVKGKFGPPKFEKASFHFEKEMQIEMKMNLVKKRNAKTNK